MIDLFEISSMASPAPPGNRIKKPKVICFDMHGTVTKWSFSYKILIPYLKQWTRYFLENNFENSDCQYMIEQLRKGQSSTGGPPIPPKTAEKEDVIEAVNSYVIHCTDNFIESEGFIRFRFAVWFDGFNEGRITTPIYADVAIQIRKWRCDNQMRLFVLSHGWQVATKKFFEKTSSGDLTALIEEFYDCEKFGDLNHETTFRKLIGTIGVNSCDVAFLTKNPEAVRAARAVGIEAILVVSHRKNIDENEDLQNIPIIRSFIELEFE